MAITRRLSVHAARAYDEVELWPMKVTTVKVSKYPIKRVSFSVGKHQANPSPGRKYAGV